jgi:hypothetical protein
MGDFQEIQTVNRQSTQGFDAGYASDTQKLIVHLIFVEKTSVFELKIPADVIRKWKLKEIMRLRTSCIIKA